MAEELEHKWVRVIFSFAEWIECNCGYRPYSQQEMNAHEQYQRSKEQPQAGVQK